MKLTAGAQKWIALPQPTSGGQVTPLPFTFVPDGEIPDLLKLNRLEANLTANPQGNAAKAIEVTAGADTFHDASLNERSAFAPRNCPDADDNVTAALSDCPDPLPLAPFKIPGRLYAKGKVPRLGFDQSLTWSLATAKQGSFTLTGSLNLTTTTLGTQNWTDEITVASDGANEANSSVTFTLENTTQKFKIEGTVVPEKDASGKYGALLAGTVKSTVSGDTLGTLSMDTTEGDKFVTITYPDGSKQVLNPTQGQSPSASNPFANIFPTPTPTSSAL